MSTHHLGIAGASAPALTVDEWFEDGQSAPPVRLADLDEPFVYLNFSKSWCLGWHTSRFLTLQPVQEALNARGLAGLGRFVPVQTVFEGHDANTAEGRGRVAGPARPRSPARRPRQRHAAPEP
jgi:hypothetical protein